MNITPLETYNIFILFGSLYLPALIYCGFAPTFRVSRFCWSIVSVFCLKVIVQLSLGWAHYFNSTICLLSLVILLILSLDIKSKNWGAWLLHKEIIHLTYAHIFVFVLGLLITTCTAVYINGDWYYDWLEHYSRAIHFCKTNLPAIHLPGFSIGERTPFLNILISNDLDSYGLSFYNYQVFSLFYNSFFIVPIISFFAYSNVSPLRIVSYLVLQPIFIFNLNYHWPRLFCAALLIYAYKIVLLDKSREILLISLLCSLSILTHLTALVYVLPLYLIMYFELLTSPTILRSKFYELSKSILTPVIIFLPWLLYIQATQNSFRSASSNYFTQALSTLSYSDIFHAFYLNLISNTIPYPFLERQGFFSSVTSTLYQIDFALFSVKVDSLFGSLGVCGCILFLLYAFYRLKSTHFKWWILFFSVLCFGTLVVPRYIAHGVGHIALLPLMLLTSLYLLTSTKIKSDTLKLMFFVAILIENTFAIFLHLLFQSGSTGKLFLNSLSDFFSIPIGQTNSAPNNELKIRFKLDFLHDHFSTYTITSCLAFVFLIYLWVTYFACFYESKRDHAQALNEDK